MPTKATSPTVASKSFVIESLHLRRFCGLLVALRLISKFPVVKSKRFGRKTL